VPVTVHVGVEGRLPEQVETATYFTVAESLTNTAKHAGATVAAVEVDIEDGEVLHVRVSDDGGGGADLHAGSGLLGLKDRVEALGGRFLLHSEQGSGTSVDAQLPLWDPLLSPGRRPVHA